MALKSLKYFLFSGNKKPYYTDSNGHVLEGTENYQKPDGQLASLKNSPDGWKETNIKYARNIQYWGIFRSYILQLKFVKDGAAILHWLRWTFGIEAICFLGILRLDRLTLPYNYETYYLAEINMAKYKRKRRIVLIEALEGGLSKLLKAYENTVYEIDIDTDPEHVNVLMDGIKFDYNVKFAAVKDQEITVSANYYLGMIEVSREGRVPDVTFKDLFPTTSSSYPNDNWYQRVDKIQEVKVSGRIKLYFNQASGVELRVDTDDGTGGTSGFPQHSLVFVNGATPRPAGATEEFTFDETFTLPAGQRSHMKIYGGTGSGVAFTVLEADISIDYVYQHAASYIKALYPYRVFEKLVDKISSSKYTVQSDWLLAMRDIVITSGDALRGILTDTSDPLNPIKGAKIKTSISDFFKSMNRWGAGMSIEGIRPTVDDKLRIEPFAYYFQDTIIADLGEVSDAELSEADDLCFNTIRTGYEKKDYSDVAGRYEMNQGQQWSTPVTRIVKDLDIRSPYRADPFGIELHRINYENKKTSDSESDNDTFFLNIETEAQTDTTTDPDTVYYELYRPAYSEVIGLPHWETAFNLELTPKKSLLSNGSMLHSILELMDEKELKLTSADKNSEFSTNLGGVIVLEKESIQIGSLAAAVFRPSYITFTTKVDMNVMELIKTNPYGKIKFTVEGEVFYGFLVDGGVSIGMNDKQTWKVLSAAENNLLKFNNAA